MYQNIKPNADKIPGFYDLGEPNFSLNRSNVSVFSQNDIQVYNDLIDNESVLNLRAIYHNSPNKERVSIQGLKDVPSEMGSTRTTVWSEELAQQIYDILNKEIQEKFIVCNAYSRTDCWQNVGENSVWEFCGISPLLRFMRYENGGEHYAHYDAGFFYDRDTYRTLKSFVLYLTTNEVGRTRFIEDGQDDVPQSLRLNLDWSRRVEPHEVKLGILPKAGSMLVFNHRECHDVEPFVGNESRMIIRGDFVYKKHSVPMSLRFPK